MRHQATSINFAASCGYNCLLILKVLATWLFVVAFLSTAKCNTPLSIVMYIWLQSIAQLCVTGSLLYNEGSIACNKLTKISCPKYVYTCTKSYGDYVLHPSSVSWEWSAALSHILGR